MGKINVDELAPGMVLGSDLFAPNDRFLLPKGTVLQEKHFQIFKTWGVTEAEIKDVSEKEVEESTYAQFDPKIIEESKQLVEKRFVHANLDQEAMAELFRLAVLRLAHNISAGQDAGLFEGPEVKGEDISTEEVSQQKTTISLSEIIDGDFEFVSLPDIFEKINEALKNPRCSSAYIANIVGADIALSAKILKLVNSAFYGFPQEIDSLARAVTILGTRQLTTLALGISVISLFKDVPEELIDMQLFWKHSVSCGVISRLLASMINNISVEPYFVAGLLHDVGRLVLLKAYPDIARETLQQCGQQQVLLHVVEAEYLGFDHTKIAGLLFEKWKLPKSLENTVKFHHSPGRALSKLEPSVIHLADIITHTCAMGKSGNQFVPPLEHEAWEVLGFSKSVLAQVITQSEYQINELIYILFMK